MNVKERFLKYVSFHTTSDENSETVPSTKRQKLLGEYIENEMKELGMKDVRMDEMGYVYGYLPATDGFEGEALGLIAHMDTSPDVSGENIKAQTVKYTGGDLKLSERETMKVKDFPSLEKYIGEELIVTDGTTLLGADDKAGIAEILTACEYLINHPEIPHRGVAVGFTPDEEIGRGADHFDLENFKAKVAYTVDGGELGEIEYENFNAASARITVNGVNIHPGSAKNKMKNAILMASDYINHMPHAEIPAHTEGYEGFYHVAEISGDESKAVFSMIIRDHDMEKFNNRKQFILDLTDFMNKEYGEGTFECEMADSYYNMKEKILPHMYLIENAEKAMRDAGALPQVVAIRGGTDGARLSYEGLPCPNLSTGGVNFHSKYEYIPVKSLETMVEVILNLLK